MTRRDSERSAVDTTEEYRKKARQEASEIARDLRESGHPKPMGDAASGILVLVEQPVGPRVMEALEKSLSAVHLAEAYVTWSSTGLLLREILAIQPSALVSLGPGAAKDIDDLSYPLSRNPFSEATPGNWFSWTRGTSGLLLPALAPALNSEEAKKLFWRQFLALRSLSAAHPQSP